MLLAIVITGFITVIVGYIKVKPALDKLKNESDASLRKDLMDRISTLEKAQGEQTVRHSEAIAKIKTEHSEEIIRVRNDMQEQHRSCEEENRALRDQIAGLQRMMITWQLTSGQAMPLSMTPELRKMVDALVTAMEANDETRLSLVAAALENTPQ